MGRDDVYRGKAKPVLVLLSDSYSKEEISVCDSRPSSYPAYTFYLLLLSNYCPNKFYTICLKKGILLQAMFVEQLLFLCINRSQENL